MAQPQQVPLLQLLVAIQLEGRTNAGRSRSGPEDPGLKHHGGPVTPKAKVANKASLGPKPSNGLVAPKTKLARQAKVANKASRGPKPSSGLPAPKTKLANQPLGKAKPHPMGHHCLQPAKAKVASKAEGRNNRGPKQRHRLMILTE